MSEEIRNKFYREKLLRELKEGYLEATKEITVKGIIEITKTIENLEIELDNARKEILRLNNINIEEDIKELISNEDIPSITDYKSILDDRWWYRVKIKLDESIIEKNKLRKCSIIRFKNEISLNEYIKSNFNILVIKEVKNILGKKILIADNVELISLISKDENKYILIYKFISRNGDEKENVPYKDTSDLYECIDNILNDYEIKL